MTVLRAQCVLQKSAIVAAQHASSRRGRQPCSQHQPGRKQPFIGAGRCAHDRSSTQPVSAEAREVDQVVQPPQRCNEDVCEEASTSASWLSATSLMLLPLLAAGPALAYNPVDGEQVVKNVAGGAYILLVCIFFIRLFRKRAKSGTSQSARTQVDEQRQQALDKKAAAQEKEATPLAALWGAVQAGVICYLLFQLCGVVDSYFERQEMPTQFTARNITVTLRTVVRGLAYLVTFLFGANCVGLSGLAIQLLLAPDSLKQEQAEHKKPS